MQPDIEKTTANSTFAIGGVSCSADSLVVAESFVLRINICGEKPAHRKSANRYASCLGDNEESNSVNEINFDELNLK